MAASRLIVVKVGDVELAAEAVPVTGTEPTSSKPGKAAEGVLDAFDRAQHAARAARQPGAAVAEDVAAEP